MDGLLEALRIDHERWDITGGLILCFVRDLPVASAEAILAQVAPRAHDLLGVGLDSAEVGFPPSLFESVFARAKALGLRLVAHAGEEGPPDYIWQALRLLAVDRVDHGIRAIEDAELVTHLVDEQIPLTVCPLSNVRLRAVDDLASHPMRALLDAGVLVTVNSDDPAYFGGYVDANYDALAAIGFDKGELVALARNSITASFASPERKLALMRLIDEWSANSG